ncbi:MAG: hypothetical protein U0U09_15240 [Cyclobacteriaceae bacterium]
MKKIVAIIAITCLCMAVSQAQTENFLDKLKGTWQAKGTAFGMPADVTMIWTTVLGGRYTQIQYTIVMHVKDGKDQQFEGTAYYKSIGENKFVATWFDSGGDMHPITATHDEATLTSWWGTPDTKMGKTTYTLKGDNSVEVTDFIQKKDGAWQQFGNNTLARKL